MSERVVHHRRIYPEDCRANPDTVYVFGDNVSGWGKAGQATIRDEPNAVGIPTKWTPSMSETAFFTDQCLLHGNGARTAIDQAFERLHQAVVAGKTISIPEDGIGTGLAQLPQRAPAVYAYIKRRLDHLGRDG